MPSPSDSSIVVPSFEAAERVADAVLYEGYVLYPYRPSAAKNQFRWQFGIVAPRAPHESGEPWFSRTECLSTATRLFVRVRCLRPQPAGRKWLAGIPVTIDVGPIDLSIHPLTQIFALDIDKVSVRLTVDTDRVGGYTKVRLRLENLESWCAGFAQDRDAILRRSLAGTHLLLAVTDGEFASLLEPPADAAALVATCENCHAWPVLVGDRADRRLMLSSPIVLYDYPAIAPESRGDLCDAAEIDEILSLRIMTAAGDEKRGITRREARPADCRGWRAGRV